MPSTHAHPTISDVYAAFDAESNRIFRAAMAHSRDGIVRVGDLQLALVEADALAAESVPPLWRAQHAYRTTGRWMTPMANEPALREILFQAFRLASDSASGEITAKLLLQAAMLQASLRPPGEAFGTAERPHPSLHNSQRSTPTKESRQIPAFTHQERVDALEAWFEDWLTRQQSTPAAAGLPGQPA